MQIDGSVVLLTGSTHGIGEACAARLSARGAQVILHGRRPDAMGPRAVQLGAKALAADLRQAGAAEELAAAALEVYGTVNAVVHCAGIGWCGTTAAMTPDQVDALLDVNLRAPLRLTRALLPALLADRPGHVAFVASIAGLTGVSGEAVYAATKAGLIAFADSLRLELGSNGIGISVVSPGAVDTAFFEHRGAPYSRHFPRPVDPDRVACAVLHDIERGRGNHTVPRWLSLAPAVKALLPRTFTALNRRFG